MGILINWIVSAAAIVITAYILPGVHLNNYVTALIVAVVLGIINAIIRPILIILTLPITIVTLGLFTFVINALLILLVSYLVKGFQVDGFLWALVFSIVLSIVNALLQRLAGE